MIFFVRCLSSFRCHWVHMFWYYSCIIITPFTQWHKIAMDYAHGICGSGIWSWQRMACCVFSSVSGFQLEALKAGGRGILKARSFTCLVVNSGCWLRASVSLHVVSSFEPVWVSSLHGGWIPKAKKVGEGRKREQCEHQVEAITSHDLASEVAWRHFRPPGLGAIIGLCLDSRGGKIDPTSSGQGSSYVVRRACGMGQQRQPWQRQQTEPWPSFLHLPRILPTSVTVLKRLRTWLLTVTHPTSLSSEPFSVWAS